MNSTDDAQPRRPKALTSENIHQWASAYTSGVERGIQLSETEVGHALTWARAVAKGIEPDPGLSP
jgi:hypothetical protein